MSLPTTWPCSSSDIWPPTKIRSPARTAWVVVPGAPPRWFVGETLCVLTGGAPPVGGVMAITPARSDCRKLTYSQVSAVSIETSKRRLHHNDAAVAAAGVAADRLAWLISPHLIALMPGGPTPCSGSAT